ncbi:pirin family protein [Emticicia sp. W12TSBA100-4]|uniref:pirin family protein n=1 Tax=Emticicia sp. W12TSBA100-4 TaxID=3160965 RepID=UPI0033063884
MTQNEAKIFLSAQRGKTELSWFRSFHSFNFGSFQDPNKEHIGKLRVLNDNTLAAGCGMKMQVEKPTEVLILPLVGGIEFKNSVGYHDFLEAGKLQIFSAEAEKEYEVLNPYESELINYLEIWIEQENAIVASTTSATIDLEKQNELLLIFSSVQQNAFGYFGKYDSREEGIYQIKNACNCLYVFVIEGAFEVDNKLMEARDGLAIWNAEEIEFEALSNDAMLLIFEIPA